jgi:hypothetical protein
VFIAKVKGENEKSLFTHSHGVSCIFSECSGGGSALLAQAVEKRFASVSP